jgi:hypothetical protein
MEQIVEQYVRVLLETIQGTILLVTVMVSLVFVQVHLILVILRKIRRLFPRPY